MLKVSLMRINEIGFIKLNQVFVLHLICHLSCAEGISNVEERTEQSSSVLDISLNSFGDQGADLSTVAQMPDLSFEDMELPQVVDASVAFNCDILTLCEGMCVDLMSNDNHCGACLNSCSVANGQGQCEQGQCSIIACDQDYEDVDGNFNNGCELFNTCEPNQSCITSCGSEGQSTCSRGEMECDPPSEICNLQDDDCDNRCDENTQSVGCRIAIHRGVRNDLHLYTSDLEYLSAAGYTVEISNYFYLYNEHIPGSQAVHFCLNAQDRHSLATSNNCNGGRSLRLLGFMLPNSGCGSRPLHYLRHPSSGDYLYPRSDQEIQNATGNFGYVNQGVIGHVWLSP